MERRLWRCQSLARNAPFRKIAVKAFTSKQTANERAAKKGLAATRTLPVGQVGCRKIISHKSQGKYQTWKKKKISKLQHGSHEQPKHEEAQAAIGDPCVPEARLHACNLNRSSCISNAFCSVCATAWWPGVMEATRSGRFQSFPWGRPAIRTLAELKLRTSVTFSPRLEPARMRWSAYLPIPTR